RCAMIGKKVWTVTVITLSFLIVSLVSGFARDPLDAVAGRYAGSGTIGDPRDGSSIPPGFLMAIDLGLPLEQNGTQWSGQLSLKRFVTTVPPGCTAEGPSRELAAPLESLTIQPDGTFQAVSGPMPLCINRQVVERRVQLSGVILTRNNCAYVEI